MVHTWEIILTKFHNTPWNIRTNNRCFYLNKVNAINCDPYKCVFISDKKLIIKWIKTNNI